MRINNINNVQQMYNKNKGVNKVKESTKMKEDQIDISSLAKDVQFGLSKIKDVNVVRTEKVEAIKAQVSAGTYEINGQKIADKLIEDLSFNKRDRKSVV